MIREVHSEAITGFARAIRAQGFTLLELLVVVAIIGLPVGQVGPRYLSQGGKSEVTGAGSFAFNSA